MNRGNISHSQKVPSLGKFGHMHVVYGKFEASLGRIVLQKVYKFLVRPSVLSEECFLGAFYGVIIQEPHIFPPIACSPKSNSFFLA
jgi:hypothetical protein